MEKQKVISKENSGFLGWIERTGNRLPDPVLLFVIFAGFIIVISWIGFLLGLALLEGTGLANVLMRRFFVKMPPKYVTLALVFVAVSSSMASDAGFMLLPPLAAMLFLATGRNPIVGIVAAYGSVAAGFASSFFISIVEVVGMGYTQQAAQIIDPSIVVPVTSNYYYTFVSSILLPLSAFFVTVKVVEPRLGKYIPENPDILKNTGKVEITEAESKGLRTAGIAALAYIAVIAIMTLPQGAVLRDPETGGLMSSPF